MAPRSTEIRHHFTTLGRALACEFDANYDDPTRRWRVTWQDGPTEDRVRRSVERDLKDHADVIGLRRDYSEDATVLGALRMYTSGAVDEYSGYVGVQAWVLRDEGRRLLERVPDPLSTATGQEKALVAHLLQQTVRPIPSYGGGPQRHTYPDGEAAVGLLVKAGGLGPLLAGDGEPPVDLTPTQFLTITYATDGAGAVWRRYGRPMSARAAVDAVLADPHPTPAAAAAARTLLPALRAELDAA
ncbi:hypothetical protein ABTX81_30210, partial [Kitasatospora sp. NPDC097605]|uniref:hypothetical protein n=1 Tax=Kitasatospora sp. NPDC097605 TaxID=3157226 RepID=UPI003333C50D